SRSRFRPGLGGALPECKSRHGRGAPGLAPVVRRRTQAGGENAGAAAEAVARRSYGKLVALLAARTRDVAAAEDALSEAFAAALVDWPASGIPSNPEAWLMTVARRKLIDVARRRSTGEAAAGQLEILSEG